MKKLQISDTEVMSIAIRQEIERNDESRYDHRLHGVLLVANGMAARQAALWLNESERTVQRWVNRFEQSGFAGLQEGERPGRPKRLDEEQWQRLEQDLRRDPREFGFAQTLWDGKLLAEHLRRRYRVKLGVRQCQRLFRQMGFRLRKPRPVIAKADPAAQAAFKKTAPSSRRSED
jgi:transposase